jgi:hypothetical protein
MAIDGKIPAIPPEDYKGSISGWMTSLIERGLWNGEKPTWYGDVHILQSEWWEILEENEN